MGAQAITREGKRKRPNVRRGLRISAVIKRGVPENRIQQDFAGLRTLDSIVRMHAVFGRPRFVVVSPRFHLERALFPVDHFTIEAIGFAAEEATGVEYTWVHLREYPARVKALLDVYLLDTGPRFLGEPVDTSLVEES